MSDDSHKHLLDLIHQQIKNEIDIIFHNAHMESWSDERIKSFIESHHHDIQVVFISIIREFFTIENALNEATLEDISETIYAIIPLPFPEEE